jgi:hypothetical protein
MRFLDNGRGVVPFTAAGEPLDRHPGGISRQYAALKTVEQMATKASPDTEGDVF